MRCPHVTADSPRTACSQCVASACPARGEFGPCILVGPHVTHQSITDHAIALWSDPQLVTEHARSTLSPERFQMLAECHMSDAWWALAQYAALLDCSLVDALDVLALRMRCDWLPDNAGRSAAAVVQAEVRR